MNQIVIILIILLPIINSQTCYLSAQQVVNCIYDSAGTPCNTCCLNITMTSIYQQQYQLVCLNTSCSNVKNFTSQTNYTNSACTMDSANKSCSSKCCFNYINPNYADSGSFCMYNNDCCNVSNSSSSNSSGPSIPYTKKGLSDAAIGTIAGVCGFVIVLIIISLFCHCYYKNKKGEDGIEMNFANEVNYNDSQRESREEKVYFQK